LELGTFDPFMRKRNVAILALALFLSQLAFASGFEPEHGQHAMVSTVHPEASRVGVDIMRKGGNAVDSAVAIGFALAVVHPAAGNIGGGGFMLYRDAKSEIHFLDYREKAPAAATANMYLDAQGNVIPEASTIGYKAVGVPGSVAGLVYAQKHWGKLPLATVMAPAIALARDGVVLTYNESRYLHNKELERFPESKRIFQHGGNFYQQGELFKQPELAQTLERIAKNPDEFYHGAMAKQIAAAVRNGGGLINEKDLADYEVKERSAIHGTYRGFDIYSAPPPSSGGTALVEALNILEGFNLHSLGARSAQEIHLVTEAYRRAFYDRAEFLGDSDFAQIPIPQLTDKRYANLWRESINPDHASNSHDLKRPSFADLDRLAESRAPYTGPEPEHTTHYSIVDSDGAAVAVTTTLNDSFGSRVTVEGLGFLLNNEMDDFSSKPGVPNAYGLIQGPANAIGPGHRPLSAMTPTIVTKDGKLALVLGSPGGPTIITTVANALINSVDFGMDIQEAVNSPRFHHQWLPDELKLETQHTSPDTIRLLEKMGHKLDLDRDSWGDAECIAIDPRTGERLGASDARNGGKALGY
jgi:gamma-glutamyltranspeptidase / glutathione hydrolase